MQNQTGKGTTIKHSKRSTWWLCLPVNVRPEQVRYAVAVPACECAPMSTCDMRWLCLPVSMCL